MWILDNEWIYSPWVATDPNNLWYFTTLVALQTAYPSASAWNYASVWETDSWWFWDNWTVSWVNSWSSVIPKFMTTITDPWLNLALTTAILDAYSWIIITTTWPTNNQTFEFPSSPVAWLEFTVINKDISTDSINIIHNWITTIYNPWQAWKYIWDWSVWVLVDIVSASDITFIPAWNLTSTNVQSAIEENNVNISTVDDDAFFYALAFW